MTAMPAGRLCVGRLLEPILRVLQEREFQRPGGTRIRVTR